MFRKITLITLVVVLGLAVFAGCSNEGVTGTDSSAGNSNGGKDRDPYVAGTISYIARMSFGYAEGADVTLTEQGETEVLGSDTADANGEYQIDMGGPEFAYGWYTVHADWICTAGEPHYGSKDFEYHPLYSIPPVNITLVCNH